MDKISAKNPFSPRHAAFTLVELLVVVACVGLVAGILFPSIQDALGQSRQSVCLARLHDIGQANLVYSADDWSMAAIPVHALQTQQDPNNPTFIGAYEWGGKSGVGQPGTAVFGDNIDDHRLFRHIASGPGAVQVVNGIPGVVTAVPAVVKMILVETARYPPAVANDSVAVNSVENRTPLVDIILYQGEPAVGGMTGPIFPAGRFIITIISGENHISV